MSRFDGPATGEDSAGSMTINPQGSTLFVTGTSENRRMNSIYGSIKFKEWATVVYDTSDGQQKWVSRSSGFYGYSTYSIAVSPDGSRVFVAAESGSGWAPDYTTVAYVSETDNQTWTARYNGTGDAGDYPRSMAVSPSGDHIYVTGLSWGTYGGDFLTVSYDTGWCGSGGYKDGVVTTVGGRAESVLSGSTELGPTAHNLSCAGASAGL